MGVFWWICLFTFFQESTAARAISLTERRRQGETATGLSKINWLNKRLFILCTNRKMKNKMSGFRQSYVMCFRRSPICWKLNPHCKKFEKWLHCFNLNRLVFEVTQLVSFMFCKQIFRAVQVQPFFKFLRVQDVLPQHWGKSWSTFLPLKPQNLSFVDHC